ncbi:MAG: cyclopropane fatty acyl phospholipid synthase [Deltaproteobacteria bacterium]|nr:cyclopropane fatty acyl phospholipid synthase [Deltaproteobacteria bacterium]
MYYDDSILNNVGKVDIKKRLYNFAKSYLTKVFLEADIVINGDRPWDIQVKDHRFYGSVLRGGSLGFGESYMKGWWDCAALDQVIFKILRRKLDQNFCKKIPDTLRKLKYRIFNCQGKRHAFKIGEHHYDAGNDLFTLMLDPYMAYSCAYWRHAHNLDEAQEAKLELICRKLLLKPGMRMLDIGCGWGSLVLYAARNFGVEAVGLTVSQEQAKIAKERCNGLPVEIRLQDYRDVSGSFDAVASVGMFEHVGYKNYKAFINVVNRTLREDGLFLLHTIGSNRTTTSCDPWLDKYIFPNGMLPSIRLLSEVTEARFIMEDWQNLNVDYDKTVMSWYQNFEAGWDKIKHTYGETFRRMWRYYLLSSAGGFRARYIQVWQIVFSPRGDVNGYRSVR